MLPAHAPQPQDAPSAIADALRTVSESADALSEAVEALHARLATAMRRHPEALESAVATVAAVPPSRSELADALYERARRLDGIRDVVTDALGRLEL